MKSNLNPAQAHWLLLALFSALFSFEVVAEEAFPGRAIYPDIPVISTEDLYQRFEQSIIVDTRSPYEYQTLRIKGAINIPLKLNNEKFISKIQELRASSAMPIIFYCNGHSCMKSYKATRKAILFARADNVYAYDAGVFDWAKQHPELAELLGKSPVRPEQLISREHFDKHLMPAVEFIKTAGDKAVIIDIRDRIQRDGFYIFSGHENSIPLNEKDRLQAVIRKAKNDGRPLYIYDAVGKQVRWLQYYLEAENVTDYYFMKGGANAFFDIPIDELMDS